MSVEADKKRDESLGSYAVTDTTQSNYCNTFSTTPKQVTTYLEGTAVSKTGYSRPSEIDKTSGTLINPNGV